MSKQAEYINALLRHSTFIQKLGNGQAKKFRDAIVLFTKRIEKQLFKEELTLLSKKRLARQLLQLKALISTLQETQTKSMNKYLKDLVRYERNFIGTLANDKIQFDKTFSLPSIQQIDEQILKQRLPFKIGKHKSTFQQFMNKFFTGFENETIQSIRDGILLGRPNQQIMKDIVRISGAKRRTATTLARTFTNYAANTVRTDFYRANSDIVKKVRWLSTLDSLTCPECGILDQQEFELDNHPDQPHHYNCRCTMQPVLEDDLNQAAGVKIQRAGVDEKGNIKFYDGRTSYQSFLAEQSDAFKREHLGKTRFELYKKTNVLPKEFVDSEFHLINLDRLRQLDDKFNLNNN